MASLAQKVRRRIGAFIHNKRRIGSLIRADEASPELVRNTRILSPAQDVSFDATDLDAKFLKICKYYREGSYRRPTTFTCEVPQAYCHIGSGLICTKDFKAISDSQMEYRFGQENILEWHKPLKALRLKGTYSTINNVYSAFWWHWLADCLPRIFSLQRAYPDENIVLLMPEKMGPDFEDSLSCVLPPNITVRYLPKTQWVKVDRMLLASYSAGRCNGHLPPEYINFIRQSVFSKFKLSENHTGTQRIYVSRARTRHRRVLNEEKLVELLKKFGFKSIALETLTFKQEVELFHDAEVVIAPHGSNWGNIIFSGRIKIFVLYPDTPPNTHIFTLAKAMGQEHYFLAYNEPSEFSDFEANLADVERMLTEEMKLKAI